MTQKEEILNILSKWLNNPLSCAEIYKLMQTKPGYKKGSMYQMGGISSRLLELVKAGKIQYGGRIGPKGGKTYKIIKP